MEGCASQSSNQAVGLNLLQQRAHALKARKEAAEAKATSSLRKDMSASVPAWSFGAVPWFSQVLEEQRQHLKSQRSSPRFSQSAGQGGVPASMRPTTAPTTTANVEALKRRDTLPTRSSLALLRSRQSLSNHSRQLASSAGNRLTSESAVGSDSRPVTAPVAADAKLSSGTAVPSSNTRLLKIRGKRASIDDPALAEALREPRAPRESRVQMPQL